MLQPLPGYEMPSTIICGAKPGKTILITAGLHSGEYPGIPAVIRTARDLNPDQVTGNIVMVHCVNTSGFCEKEWIGGYCNDLRLLLQHLGYHPYDRQTSVEKHVFVKTIYLEAAEDGVWYCHVRPDDKVKRGQLLGRTEDFFGNVLHEYYAEADGLVFYHCCGLSVKTGRNLVAYGVEEA